MIYFYNQILNQPDVQIIKGLQYDLVFIIHSSTDEFTDYREFYPVIHVSTTLKNIGKATARDCACNIKYAGEEYMARWRGKNEETIDLHPGQKNDLIITRYFLSFEDMKKFNVEYLGDPQGFPEINNSILGKPIMVKNKKVYLSTIRNKSGENRTLERAKSGPSDVFYGGSVSNPKNNADINIDIMAENYIKKVNKLGKISLEKGITLIENKYIKN